METMIYQFFVPSIVISCYVIGVIIKKCISRIDNKYIPLINAVAGIILSCALNKSVTLDYLIQGMVSGWASTGVFEAMRNLTGRRGEG